MSQQDAESRVADLAAALPVREGDEPWTAEEVTEVVTTLRADVERMGANLAKAQTNLADLMTEGSDGAGKDPADVGSSQFERDQEISLTRNAQLVYDQSRLALKRIEEGTYGTCENCGRPIGKARLQAFPRATMCVACKQREERR